MDNQLREKFEQIMSQIQSENPSSIPTFKFMEAAYQLGKSNNWTKSSECLPAEDGYIWAHCSIRAVDERVWFDNSLPNTFKTIYSHWMPLPQPPQQ